MLDLCNAKLDEVFFVKSVTVELNQKFVYLMKRMKRHQNMDSLVSCCLVDNGTVGIYVNDLTTTDALQI